MENLIRKLLLTSHLNVAERKKVPCPIPYSALKAELTAIVDEMGAYPKDATQWKKGVPIGEFPIIKKQNSNKYVVVVQEHGSSVGTPHQELIFEFSSLSEAIDQFIKLSWQEKHGLNIDGVQIQSNPVDHQGVVKGQ